MAHENNPFSAFSVTSGTPPTLVGNVTFDTPVPVPGASDVFQQTANVLSNTAQGWECPRCHRMNSPFMPWCDCKPSPGKAEEHRLEGICTDVQTWGCPRCHKYHLPLKQGQDCPPDAIELKPATSQEPAKFHSKCSCGWESIACATEDVAHRNWLEHGNAR